MRKLIPRQNFVCSQLMQGISKIQSALKPAHCEGRHSGMATRKAVTKINAHCLVRADTKKQFQGFKWKRERMIDKKWKKWRTSSAGRNGKGE